MELPRLIPDECKLYDVDGTRKMDEYTINTFGIDGFTLMEIAGSGAAAGIREREGTGKNGLYLCGKGNNAGDALVAARYLADKADHSVTVVFVMGDDQLSNDTAKNLSLLQKLKEKNSDINIVTGADLPGLSGFHYIVDGLLGTGLRSNLREPLPAIVQQINDSGLSVYAMDIPTGLDADTGEIFNTCVKAGTTFTFGTYKLGFALANAAAYTGEVQLIELPFPGFLQTSKTFLLNKALYDSFPDMARHARHKYHKGTVHIIAGSAGLTGAAIMTAKSAWKSGAGAVILYSPEKLLPIYEKQLPQIIKVAVPSEGKGHLTRKDADKIIQKINDKSGVIIAGPGIGTAPETGACITTVLKENNNAAVLDADLFAFWDSLSNLPKEKKKKWILTPHTGEAKKYLRATYSSDRQRLDWAIQFSDKHACNLLVKGNPAIFANSEATIITGYDTSIFSRAGFGDVLAGAIGTNLAIINKPVHSCVKALYNGYLTYRDHSNEPFGPEHLIC